MCPSGYSLSGGLCVPNSSLPANAVTASQLGAFRAAIAKTRNGDSDTKILTVGDSTTAGNGSSLYATYPSYNSWPARLCALMSPPLPAFANGLAVAQLMETDNRWTVGAGWTQQVNYGFAGQSIGSHGGTPAGSLTFTPGASQGNYDSFTVYYLIYKASGTDSITMTATGGAPTTVNTDGRAADGIGSTTVMAAAAGTGNSVTITGAGVTVLAVEPSLSTSKVVRVSNGGIGGSTTTGWNDGGAYFAGPLNSIKAYAPDLSFINLGINNAATAPGGVDPSAFTADMRAIIAACRASGDVVLMSTVPSDASNAWIVPNEQLLYTATMALAASAGAPLIDIWLRFGAAFNSPLMYNGLAYAHPNNYGYLDMAAAVAAFLQSVIS